MSAHVGPTMGHRREPGGVGLEFRAREPGIPNTSGVASWLIQPSSPDARMFGETSWMAKARQQVSDLQLMMGMVMCVPDSLQEQRNGFHPLGALLAESPAVEGVF